MRWYILVVSLSVVSCRPQQQQSVFTHQDASKPTVEIQQQPIIDLDALMQRQPDSPNNKKIEQNTKEILEKIEALNRKHGLTQRRKPSYFQFPFSYSRAQYQHNSKKANFEFSNNPFLNPIFEYLKNDKANLDTVNKNVLVKDQAFGGFASVHTDTNAEITKDDIIPGQYIKRKVTHQQTYLVPDPILYQMSQMYYMPAPFDIPVGHRFDAVRKNNSLSNLEQQTIENIKNIIHNSQAPQAPMYGSPPLGNHFQQGIYFNGFPMSTDMNRPSRQQWQWPLGQFFPIVIRDPFTHMMNAFTSMVEYGPPSKPACKTGEDQNLEKRETDDEAVTSVSNEVTLTKANNSVENNNPEIDIIGTKQNKTIITKIQAENNSTLLDIEDLEILNRDKALKFTLDYGQPLPTTRNIKFREEPKTAKSSTDYNEESLKLFPSNSNIKQNTVTLGRPAPAKFSKTPEVSPEQTKPSLRPLPSFFSPTKRPAIKDEETNEKAEELVSHDGNKKLFSKDNTGSGIFIHKLKVRKGGVAIAGPGGIATAGSGGTAIVGPNGVAYTHPDSLAIAGSGTKVIAVEPSINLSDLVNGNKTKHGSRPPRVGKVVAIGPIVYYNRG